MSSFWALILVLLGLMLAVGGKQGLSNFLALTVNFGVLMLAVILMAGGFSPVAVAVVLGLTVLATTIFLATADSEVAGTAFVASLLVMALMVGLIALVTGLAHVAGFGTEDSEALEGYNLLIGVNFQQLLVAATLLATLGAIAEAAVAVAAGMKELGAATQGAEQMGAEIIGTALNTLFFGFFGGFAGLFLWFTQLHYPWWQVLNNQIFAREVLTVLLSMIAVTLTVPLTMWIVQHRKALK